MPASASAFACACACARILPRPRHSPEVRLAGEYRPRRVPPPASTARASTPSDQDRHWLESPTGDLARPDRRPFAACGFSDLRAGFVLWDESSRRERSRALHGSGRAVPEHDAGSPALGTRPPPLAILHSTNWARIPEERDARRGARVADRLASDHLPRLRPQFPRRGLTAPFPDASHDDRVDELHKDLILSRSTGS